MAGAWDCYPRSSARRVLGARGVAERHHGSVRHGWLRKRLETWMADPRTTIPQLRTALEEAVKTRPRPEWHAFSLKMEYLDWMRQLETMKHPDLYVLEWDRAHRLGDMGVAGRRRSPYHVRRFLRQPNAAAGRSGRFSPTGLRRPRAGVAETQAAVQATVRDATQTTRRRSILSAPSADAAVLAVRTGELGSSGRRHEIDRDE